jgi:hypothetical protein
MTTIRYGRPPTAELRPARGRHGARRPRLRLVLAVAGLAELAAAVGWIAGYGASPSGAVMAFNAALLLALAGAVRS